MLSGVCAKKFLRGGGEINMWRNPVSCESTEVGGLAGVIPPLTHKQKILVHFCHKDVANLAIL